MTALPVKLLVEKCGRCGGDVVGDNMGTGRPWQHIAGPDDHNIVFGTPAPDGVVRVPATLDDLEAVLDDDAPAEFPPPGTPHPADDADLGGARTGTRQMVNAAVRAGFTVETTLCTGPVRIGRQHDPRGFRYVDSLLVGFRHPDGRAAVAVWERLAEVEGDSFAFTLCFVKGQGMKSSPELKAFLKAAPA